MTPGADVSSGAGTVDFAGARPAAAADSRASDSVPSDLPDSASADAPEVGPDDPAQWQPDLPLDAAGPREDAGPSSLDASWCRPCHSDTDCGARLRCAALEPDAGSFCLPPCAELAGCPPGSGCVVFEIEGEPALLCHPEAAECPCSAMAVADSASTPCAVANDLGSCSGLRVCAEDGLTACDAPVPTEETCNDVDDDCDGAVDEEWPAKGAPCDGDDADDCPGGIFVCQAADALVCDDDAISIGDPCNGADDDCDGLTDEDYGDASQPCDGAGSCTPAAPLDAAVLHAADFSAAGQLPDAPP